MMVFSIARRQEQLYQLIGIMAQIIIKLHYHLLKSQWNHHYVRVQVFVMGIRYTTGRHGSVTLGLFAFSDLSVAVPWLYDEETG